MVADRQGREDGLLDTSLLVRSIRYYSIIGAGVGLLGIISIAKLGGRTIGGEIISILALLFAVLVGPIIAAFNGYATAERGTGAIRQRSVNSGLANGIGFGAYGIVVAMALWIGLWVVVDSSRPVESPITGEILVQLILLMTIPNAFVGAGITFFSKRETGSDPENSLTVAASSTSLPPEAKTLEVTKIIINNYHEHVRVGMGSGTGNDRVNMDITIEYDSYRYTSCVDFGPNTYVEFDTSETAGVSEDANIKIYIEGEEVVDTLAHERKPYPNPYNVASKPDFYYDVSGEFCYENCE